ncbi:PREDICTED: serine/threonine-protein kinase-like protein ACR4 [Nelumbo nucifera]|uniref:Serine/threonine-protein kinase-like protein ACR4 n=2 Tax=Nelumbo nucifera TaxID=4432 RepID=A0A1U8AF92_NELNU|nr:PREDICTED: serine/threonine-protein kinase-like protein ACR4 [Nelumbo nucifera]DAD22780.1 TPA_asm: hypothetical protein HUJ06_024243 [Nelumbo nucifera]
MVSSTSRASAREVSNMSHGSTSTTIAYDGVMALLATALVILSLILIIILCRKKPMDPEEGFPAKLCARAYSLTDVDVATDGFNQRLIIGAGRLGTVYEAHLTGGDVVAAKRIHPRLVLSNAGFGFSSIVKSLSFADHPHVVPIIGLAEAPGERIILMEFMGMRSLDYHLRHDCCNGAPLLDWELRLRVAAGAARGIEYLHEKMTPPIVHGCVKPSNILIDSHFCARVSDYGLCFLAPHERRGLVGYVDDEYWKQRGGACKASDVYGFGVVLLQILSGRRCEEGLIAEWALPLIRDMKLHELLDPRLVVPSDIEPLFRLAKVASACVSNSRRNRPSIVQVAAILNNLERGLCSLE